MTRKYFLFENNHETAAALPGAVSMLSPVNSDYDRMCGGASQYDHLTLHTIIQAKGGEIVYCRTEK